MSLPKRSTLAVVIVVVLFGLAIGGYIYIVSGGLIARQKPSTVESRIAGWLVRVSVPASAKRQKNPLTVDPTGVNVSAGLDLYKQKCETCHGYDGSGKTEAGGGLYPPPLDLRSPEVKNATDGELFYFIRNGIRNTAMPGGKCRIETPGGWSFSFGIYPRSHHSQAERLRPRYLRYPLRTSARPPVDHAIAVSSSVGAKLGWRTWFAIRMSIPMPSSRIYPNPTHFSHFRRTISPSSTEANGSSGTLRESVMIYFPLPAQWDVTHKIWRAYNVKPGTDWWTPYYPADNMQRPTGPTCDGCHSVNYDVATKKVTEWNVGCEKCHGPGSEHVKQPSPATIVNPASLNYVDAN